MKYIDLDLDLTSLRGYNVRKQLTSVFIGYRKYTNDWINEELRKK